MVEFNTFAVPDLVALAIMGPLAIGLYCTYLWFGRTVSHLLLANLVALSAVYCLLLFLADNTVLQGAMALEAPHGASRTVWLVRIMHVTGLLAMASMLHFAVAYSRKGGFLAGNILWVYFGILIAAPVVLTDLFFIERRIPLTNTSTWWSCVPWTPEPGLLFAPICILYILSWVVASSYTQFLLWPSSDSDQTESGRAFRSLGGIRWGIMPLLGGVLVELLAVGVFNYAGPSIFPATSLATAVILAGILARDHIQLERAKNLMDKELQIVHRIQRGLLPKSLPEPDGFDIAAWSHAVDAAGGDLYDFIALPDGRCMILVADVSGHGIGSALLAAEVHALFRAIVAWVTDVTIVLQELHHLLLDDLGDSMGVTCFLGQLDPRTSQLSYVSAGQAPLIFYSRSADEFTRESATNMPLYGVLLGMESDSELRRRSFDPGDMLVVPTDGMWEVFDQDERMLGAEGLCQIIAQCHRANAEGVIDAVRKGLTEFAVGGKQADDQTMVVVQRRISP